MFHESGKDGGQNCDVVRDVKKTRNKKDRTLSYTTMVIHDSVYVSLRQKKSMYFLSIIRVSFLNLTSYSNV